MVSAGEDFSHEDAMVAIDTRSSLNGPDCVSKKLSELHVSRSSIVVHERLELACNRQNNFVNRLID